jgi:sulfopyruvate decarboxylase alpha subunit
MLAATSNPEFASLEWQQAIADALAAARVATVAYIPDARLRGIVSALDGPTPRILTREEECIAYASGQLAVGHRAVVFMQCSGLGNALNALGSLSIPYELMPPMVISMRGSLGEGNPAQVPMGRATRPILEALGIQVFNLADPSAAGATMAGALELSFRTGTGAAVLLDALLGGGRERD